MKPVCALFALLLLLLLPFTVMAGTGGENVRVIDKNGNDITDANTEKGDSHSSSSDSKPEDPAPEDDSGLWESTIKAFQTAVSNGMTDFSYSIINQLMAGSETILEADTVDGENNESSGMITYSIKTEDIKPFEPAFVQKSILYTGGFYILIAFFVILGSYLMLLLYNNHTVQFVDFMASATGEERPYDTNMQITASVGAGVIWVIFVTLIVLISGFRNIVVRAVSPHEVVLPAMYADSLPTQLLTSLASYFNAMQSALGTYGIHTFASLIMITASISIIILMLGAVRGFTYFTIFSFGAYTLFNFIDIVNTCSLSVGVQLYLSYGNPIFVTIGLIFGGGLNVLIMYLLIRYGATRIGLAIEEL